MPCRPSLHWGGLFFVPMIWRPPGDFYPEETPVQQESTEEQQMWRRWQVDRDETARTWLIEHFTPLVYAAQRSFKNVRRQDQDDLVGAGLVGLVQSVDKWNPALKPWLEFARFRIRAAMVDAIRK